VGAQAPTAAPPRAHADAGLQTSIARILELERQREHKHAEQLLASTKGIPSERAGALQVALGDLHGERNDLTGALAHYEIAIKFAPSFQTPAMRKAQTLAAMGPPMTGALLEWSAMRQGVFPTVAEFGYRSFLERSAPDAEKLEFALLAWTNLLASGDRFVAGGSMRLSGPGTAQALVDLNAVLDTGRVPPPTSWWSQRRLRQNALANVARSVGRSLLSRGQFAVAERVLRNGLTLAGHPDALVGSEASPSSRPVAFFDLATELASLYDSHRELDPDGMRMQEIERALFHSKAVAYGANDLEAIQRHHMVLGTIYARRNVWTSIWPPGNAVFQIERALQTAKQRESVAGVQPLAELKSLLADGYEKLGRRDASLEMRLASAQGFMDADQMDAAAEQLAAVDRAGPGSPGVLLRRKELTTVLETRREVEKLANAPRSDLNARLSDFDHAGHTWIQDISVGGLPKDFVARQRFKSYSDLSDAAFKAGIVDRAARYAADAISRGPTTSVRRPGRAMWFDS
jgi:hypothetical protein